MKKFVLVCNTSKGVYNAVTFKREDNNFTFRKFVVNGFQGILKFNMKSALIDIDKMTCTYKDEDDFLRNLKIFDPIFGLFIGYSTRGYVNRISPVFGDAQLIKHAEKFVVGEKVKKEEVDRLFNELVADKGLYKLYMKEEYFKTKTFHHQIKEYINMYEYVSKGIEGDVTGELLYRKRDIKENLSKYHLYRELLRASFDYKKMKDAKEQEKNTQYEERATSNSNAFTSDLFEMPEAYQLKFPGF